MKVKQRSFNEERTILIGMIVDRHVLGRVARRWANPMFQSPYANKVGEWCVEYYRKYQKAPGPNIQSIYESWAEDARNRNLVDLVADFLDSLSREYTTLQKRSNSQYVVDLAGQYFNKVQLNRLTETITGDLERGDIQRATGRAINFRKVEMGVGEGIDVLHDREAIQAAFDQKHECLIKYKDGLGKFFGPYLERDGFIAFQGPEKRGKSFWLQEIAFRAVLQRRRVAYFECGDLSEHQIMRRFMVRIAHHPLSAGKVKYPSAIRLVERDGEPPYPVVKYYRKSFEEPLSWRKAYQACIHLTQRHRLKSVWRLSNHYNNTLTVDAIRQLLDDWARDGWIPDVIVIDYADILNMDHIGLEGRDRIDHTWKQLRRVSQERHCLVVTATQAAARAYKAQTQSQEHFSEDKRKNAHVTGMVGLNQTDVEKERGIMRLNWIDLREGFFSPRRCCYVATCLELANMAVKSIF